MKRILSIFFMSLLIVFSSVPIYAGDVDDTQTTEAPEDAGLIDGTEEYSLDKDSEYNKEITDQLTQLFSRDLYNNKKGLQVGIGLAQPIIYVIYVFCIFIILVVSYFFMGVTMTDLAYILIPPLRGLLRRNTEKHGGPTSSSTGSLSSFGCISDSCVEAVHGSSNGSSSHGLYGGGGSGSDRGVGSCLAKYVSSRTKEFLVFVLFVLFFLTGLMGRLFVMLFNLFASLIEAVFNFA